MEAIPIQDDEYYCFMGDDDMYEPGFFDTIRKQSADIIIVSLARGDTIPKEAKGESRHPTYPLILKSLADIRVCNIGLPQFIIKGHILKQVKFLILESCGDGYYAEELRKQFPDKIMFLPDTFAFMNYFEPGR